MIPLNPVCRHGAGKWPALGKGFHREPEPLAVDRGVFQKGPEILISCRSSDSEISPPVPGPAHGCGIGSVP